MGFLTGPSVGIGISDSNIRVLELVRGRGGFELGRFGEYTIPVGTIVAGSVKDKEGLVTILKTIKNRHGLKPVRVSFPRERAFVFKTEVPSVPRRGMKTVVGSKLEESIPTAMSDVVFDFEVLPSYLDDDEVTVIISVFPKDELTQYANAFSEAGLKILSFEIEPRAVARAVVPKGDRGTYMIVDFGKSSSGVYIVSNGAVHLAEAVGIGSDALTKAVLRMYPDSDEEAVERIKIEGGFSKRRDNEKLFPFMTNAWSALRDKINKYYIRWHARRDKKGRAGEKIEKIILSGDRANIAGLPEYLADSMKTKVERANVWTNAGMRSDYIPEIDFHRSLGFSPVVGLVIDKS